ncbi:hypothetical protein NUACC21_06900 [Scytonema sp. NUACC21]
MLLCLLGCSLTPQQIQANALSQAEKYAQKSKLTVVDCSGQDSDSNGYVTCSFKDLQTQTMSSAECAYDFRVGVGCKVAWTRY